MSFHLAASAPFGGCAGVQAGKGSSVSKGETLVDTARNIEAMGVDVMVMSASPFAGAALQLVAGGELQRDQRRRRGSMSTRPRRCWTSTRMAERLRSDWRVSTSRA